MSAILKVEKQRTGNDCGVACLSMLLGKPYEEVLLLVGQDHPKILQQGLWISEIMRASEKAGMKLRRLRRFDIESAYGILCLSDHVVILKNGLIIDPADASVWEADVYLEKNKETPSALLQPKD